MADDAFKASRKPRDFDEWMWYVVLWGLAAPTVLAAVVVTGASVLAVWITGQSDLPRWIQAVLGVSSFLGYFPVQFQLTWKAWLTPRKPTGKGGVLQVGKQNVAHGGAAIDARGKAMVNVNHHHYYGEPKGESPVPTARPKMRKTAENLKPRPAMAFTKNNTARTLTIVTTDPTDWSDLEVYGAETVPQGPVKSGDIISGCRSAVAVLHKPTAHVLYRASFD